MTEQKKHDIDVVVEKIDRLYDAFMEPSEGEGPSLYVRIVSVCTLVERSNWVRKILVRLLFATLALIASAITIRNGML